MNMLLRKWQSPGSLAIFLLICVTGSSQPFNLVQNGSFESYSQCPNSDGQLFFAVPWTGPTTNSTDYNHACSTQMNVPYYGGIGHPYPYFLNAKDGSGYAGIHVYNSVNYREYVQAKLNDSLESGKCYYVEFFAANTQNAKYGTNNLAGCFSASEYPVSLMYPGTIPNIPLHITNFGNPVLRDTVKWNKIAGVYEATGVEKFFLIGNFKTDSQTDTLPLYKPGTPKYAGLTSFAYTYIDAISVYSINLNSKLPWSYRDTTINRGDSVFIGNNMGGLNFKPQWFGQNSEFIKTNSGITVSPTTTTKYYVQYTLCGTQRRDSIKVVVIDSTGVEVQEEEIFRESVLVFPNPAKDHLRITGNFDCGAWGISIEDLTGKLVERHEVNMIDGAFDIVLELDAGVYIITISKSSVENAICVRRKLVICRD
jgi:hypothetical protein